MNGQFVYEQYTALKSHFNTNYDYFQFNGSLKNINRESYELRNDKLIFEKFAKKHNSSDIVGALVSHFIINPGFWIGDYNHKIYLDWKRRVTSQDYLFHQDVNKIFLNVENKADFKRLFIHPSGQHPLIFQLLLTEEITIESFTIFNAIFPFFNVLNKNIDIPIVWDKKRNICQKYVTFLQFDADKYKAILSEKINEL